MSKSHSRLALGENFCLSPQPQISPTQSSPHILVIGGGVTGLVNAWVLLDRGYRVTDIAKEWASYTQEQRLTSQIAGTLWEYPPAVCGQHTDEASLSNSKRWCMVAYLIWNTIAANPDLAATSGVQMKNSTFFFPCRIEDDPTSHAREEDARVEK
jgi:D-amino-acid oxidase